MNALSIMRCRFQQSQLACGRGAPSTALYGSGKALFEVGGDSGQVTAHSETMGLVVLGPSLHPGSRPAPEWVS